jgi:hypothetical protein
MGQINSFTEVVDACYLCDLGYISLDWTFKKKIHNGIRLDRALDSGEVR